MTTPTALHATADPAAPADPALARAWRVLEAVPDPEIPVVSIRELGILREVRRAADGVLEVLITPTYSGCPAMAQIAADIGHALEAAQLAPYRVATVLAPAWTTDWITAAAREKLRAYGIAPPTGDCGAAAGAPPAPPEQALRFVPRALPAPACPRCGSAHTERLAQFGSTACKALYRCLDCREPFDYFKPY
ncbi:phenylacetate-CoA oxygenase subunit PaaJ [Paraburkholderia sp. MMS20-SJTN17]|uniref:Phenylacetate-CoA oxygenase subunit PaaJ n=1 Tax=Paraburkholderia translucens TaxID=2886945 RepID=A0ABS8KCC0_9BURK|nr:1,2-phenylacetyl-CoA epoxidase subunit PaaD [Paraburkholderia sp. MMS20-SJTN17]MCC8402373.1 phenylacetate-CoA oxygenase subunit PaaJ [Paraburkholderia sp. MMS20-SJTN17]